ncbi:hypothetical protein ON010_g16512 [Phytophthora cinnamomi]|nr:hypothetical protein ON010_g16512 [Phytophthora cinnamomi]
MPSHDWAKHRKLRVASWWKMRLRFVIPRAHEEATYHAPQHQSHSVSRPRGRSSTAQRLILGHEHDAHAAGDAGARGRPGGQRLRLHGHRRQERPVRGVQGGASEPEELRGAEQPEPALGAGRDLPVPGGPPQGEVPRGARDGLRPLHEGRLHRQRQHRAGPVPGEEAVRGGVLRAGGAPRLRQAEAQVRALPRDQGHAQRAGGPGARALGEPALPHRQEVDHGHAHRRLHGAQAMELRHGRQHLVQRLRGRGPQGAQAPASRGLDARRVPGRRQRLDLRAVLLRPVAEGPVHISHGAATQVDQQVHSPRRQSIRRGWIEVQALVSSTDRSIALPRVKEETIYYPAH